MKDDKSYIHTKIQDIPLYRSKLMYILSNDIEKVRIRVPIIYDVVKDGIMYAHSLLLVGEGYERYCILLNYDCKHRKMYSGTVAHEALHICNMIADNRGIKHDTKNDEPMAYLLEYIVTDLNRFADKHGLKTHI